LLEVEGFDSALDFILGMSTFGLLELALAEDVCPPKVVTLERTFSFAFPSAVTVFTPPEVPAAITACLDMSLDLSVAYRAGFSVSSVA
jgi:hypothetical protein